MLRNCLLSFLAGILFCWLVLNPLIEKLTHKGTHVSYRDIVTTKVSVTRDTIFVPRFLEKKIVLQVPVAKVVDRLVLDTLRLDSYAKTRYADNFTSKTYEDTVEVEKNVQVGYKAQVTGKLTGMEVSFKDYRPQLVIHDSIHTERTLIEDRSHGLYLGVGGTSNLRYLGPHLMYQDKQGNAFRVGVNALSLPKRGIPEISIGYSRKLL